MRRCCQAGGGCEGPGQDERQADGYQAERRGKYDIAADGRWRGRYMVRMDVNVSDAGRERMERRKDGRNRRRSPNLAGAEIDGRIPPSGRLRPRPRRIGHIYSVFSRFARNARVMMSLLLTTTSIRSRSTEGCRCHRGAVRPDGCCHDPGGPGRDGGDDDGRGRAGDRADRMGRVRRHVHVLAEPGRLGKVWTLGCLFV